MKLLRKLLLCLVVPFALLALYLGAAFVVFDFSRAALPGDEDNTEDGRPVALGPRPRSLFCRPTVSDVRWEGGEWPFVVFAPVCNLWRERHGYAPSWEEREVLTNRIAIGVVTHENGGVILHVSPVVVCAAIVLCAIVLGAIFFRKRNSN